MKGMFRVSSDVNGMFGLEGHVKRFGLERHIET